MKIKCTSPNGKSNMQTIKDSKIPLTKFNSFDKMERYINELGYVYKGRNAFKEDRSIIYRHKNNKKHVFVKSTFDYLSPITMEMGTVWTVQEFWYILGLIF